MIDRCPALIARCADVLDVVRAPSFAREKAANVDLAGRDQFHHRVVGANRTDYGTGEYPPRAPGCGEGARPVQESDLGLLDRLRSGDTRALEDLYDRFTPLLYPVAHRILGHTSDAEDVLQETWVQVWRTAGSYDPARGSLAAWLLTVVRTRALDRVRSAASRRRAESQVDPDPPTRPEDPSAAPARSQLADRVTEVLASLEQRHRQVLESAYFEGLTQGEIAERLKAPLGTVKSWTRQALLRLRELLPHEEWT